MQEVSGDRKEAPVKGGVMTQDKPGLIPYAVLLLRVRNLIAAREFNIAQANRELQCGDGWLFDHAQADREYAAEIDKLWGMEVI